ncbi:MAG: FtsX-like permease family protein [Defluviitaleaceae bacterium]|nr:FtsX-like permease family protein [Defluviitaleaceae bacterium]MCL2239203.1 FtsX-like permease family protein [Defluviitaleaceae bacterium]MCL2240312.1 FtsX-like permease family protein [Defluviitaleaceae bacterium]
MFIFQNALQNLMRNKGRNILLSAIIFAIIATTAVTLIINNTANGIIEDYRVRFGSEVNIIPDTAQIMDNIGGMFGGGGGFGGMFGGGGGGGFGGRGGLIPQVTPQQYLAFAQLPQVLSYDMTATQPAFNEHLYVVDGDVDIEIGGGMFGGGGMGGMFGGGGGMGAAMAGGMNIEEFGMPNVRLQGNYWEDFHMGLRELVDGAFPQAYGEAIISMELAELNGVVVGDTLRLYTPIMPADSDEMSLTARNLTIVGIYFDMTQENITGGFVRAAFLNRRNEVLTTLDTVTASIGYSANGVNITATYFLREPELLPYFEAELRNLGLDPMMLVTTNDAAYYAIVQPVMGLRDITSTFMIIVLVLGGIVMVFLASISIRERKYEIGVLRAMGMKKRKVALGLWAEMLTITLVCLVLGLTVGTVVAQPISDTLLAAQIENITPVVEETTTGGMSGMFGGGGGLGGMLGGGRLGGMLGGGNQVDAEPLSELDVSLGTITILQIIGISLFLATVAGVVSTMRITKYEPIKILMERN